MPTLLLLFCPAPRTGGPACLSQPVVLLMMCRTRVPLR